MNKENQIDEMAKAIEQARIKATDTTNSMNYGFGGWYAKELYNAGYRKSSEVAREIFEEIEKILRKPLTLAEQDNSDYGELMELILGDIITSITELKKKYTEGIK